MKPRLTMVLVLGLPLVAADHRNLDGGVPITVEDAYPIKFREPSFQGLLSGSRKPGLLGELEYGLARDLQLDIGARSRSRAVDLGLLYNFNTETLRVPAFALKAEADIHGDGADLTVKGILTRSLGFHRVHLNAGRTFLSSPEEGDRRGLWEGVAGWDRPVGLQSVLLADVVIRESERRGEPLVTLLEVGMRRQLTPLLVANFGAGVRAHGGPKPPRFFLAAGLTRSF